MNDEVIETLDDIVKYGRRFERRRKIDGRYAPPPPPEKMHIQSAAFAGPPSAAKARVAATGEESAPVEISKSKRKGKKSNEKGSASDASASAAEVMAMQQGPGRAYTARDGRNLMYAEATRGNERNRNNAYVPGNAQPTYQPEEAMPRERRQGYEPRAASSQASGQQNKQEPSGKTDSSKRDERRSKVPFVGPCFTCQGVEHERHRA